MNCPGCGGELNPISVMGFDDSYRCRKCGGFWLESWMVNQLPEKDLDHVVPLKVENAPDGEGLCPVDKVRMTALAGENIPTGLVIEKCEKCGWWWFPKDSLFGFKQAYDLKKNYLKVWGKKSEQAMFVLPALFTLVLVIGLSVGVIKVKNRQNTDVSASSEVTGFGSVYLGAGRTSVVFRSSGKVSQVYYKKAGEIDWNSAGVSEDNGLYTADLKWLDSDTNYVVKVLEKEFKFKTGRQDL